MNNKTNPLLPYLYLFIFGTIFITVPIVYLSKRQDRIDELKRIELQQENIQKLILEEKRKEAINIIDKQLEEMKAEDKARKEALGP